LRRLTLLPVLLLVMVGCARSSPAVPVVAVLLSDDVRLPKVEGLKAGLSELGYPAGAVQVEVYSARGDRAQLEALTRKALAGKPAVLVAGGGIEAVALKAVAPKDKPLVMMGAASSVRSGLVETLMRPGGNMTGLDNQHAELSAKRLELLVRLLPGVRRVLLLYDPLVVPGQHALEVTREAAVRLGVELAELPVQTQDQAVGAIRRLQPGQYDAALLLPAYVLESGAQQITAELERMGLPTMGPLDLGGEGGLLAAYGVSMRDQGMQSAQFVVKLLRGEAPARIPVETPDNPTLAVDMRVARRLSLQLSPVGLALARTYGGEGP